MTLLKKRRDVSSLPQRDGNNNDPEDPYQRIISLLVHKAIKENADCIIFGAPTDEYVIEERNDREPVNQEVMAQMDREFEESIAEIKRDNPSTEPRDPFKDSPVTGLPIWFCSKGKCFRDDGLPLFFFPQVIDRLHQVAHENVDISEWSKDSSRVVISVGMMKNYCYRIKIETHER